MEYKLVIEGTLPGLNEYSDTERKNSGAMAAARLKRDTQELIGWYIRAQLKGLEIGKRVRLEYKWIEPNRRRDMDNIAFAHKFVQDALVENGVIGGDGWRYISGFSDEFDVDRERPRVEILIIEEVAEDDD